jgi:hypothetical protein
VLGVFGVVVAFLKYLEDVISVALKEELILVYHSF